jgi:hypothetical protein
MARARTEANKEADKRYNAKRVGKRSRGWACVVYPDSAPTDWVDKLREGHIQTLISPIHDKDKTAEDEPKKPHYHVMAMFDNPVPDSAASAYFAKVGVTAPPEMLKSVKGYARYLIHMDDHDKYPYSDKDIITLSGAVWATVALDDGEAEEKMLDEIEQYLDDTGCTSYRALCAYARNERPEWTRVIRRRTIHLSAYLKSLGWEHEKAIRENASPKKLRERIDQETGEVVGGEANE